MIRSRCHESVVVYYVLCFQRSMGGECQWSASSLARSKDETKRGKDLVS